MHETHDEIIERENFDSRYEQDALKEADSVIHGFGKMPKEKIEKLIDRLEHVPSYKAYEDKPINLDTLESAIQGFKKNIDKTDTEALKELNNVMMLLDNVYEGIDNYQESIAKQALNNMNYSERDSYYRRDYQTERESFDRHRRLVHNGLISSLTALNRHFAREFPKYGYEIDKNNLFGQRHIEDRNFIGEWAITMAKAQPVRTALKELKKLKIKNGRSAKANTAI